MSGYNSRYAQLIAQGFFANSEMTKAPHYFIDFEIIKLASGRRDVEPPRAWPFTTMLLEAPRSDAQGAEVCFGYVRLMRDGWIGCHIMCADKLGFESAKVVPYYNIRSKKFAFTDLDAKTVQVDDETLQFLSYNVRMLLVSFWFALSVRGVTQQRVEAPEKLNKARVKRGKPPLRPYTVMKIGSVTTREGVERAVSDAEKRTISMHLRAGHKRRQPFGPRASLRKEIYIPPCIVNFTEGATAPTPHRLVKL